MNWLINAAKRIFKALLFIIIGGLIVGIAVFVMMLENRPDLKIWHHAELDAEYTAKSPVNSFKEYLALETRLFDQLQQKVFDQIQPEDRGLISRYNRGSLSDPARWSPNWNRSFELEVTEPRAGVLLLHGMSDSPYSLHTIGLRLQQTGAWVVGLRLPGHGTAPSGLVTVHWEDMAAAAKLAIRHLQAQIGDRPIYIVGYSTGGALAVHYALDALEDETLPQVERLVLISTAIGVSPFAVLAVWQARLGHLLGLDKLAWNSINPEYDPFKYNSFAVNAGDQVHRLSQTIQTRIQAMQSTGKLERFPAVLAFQSLVDATVSTQALIDGLFARLPQGGHELLLFDLNRDAEVVRLLSADPLARVEARLQASGMPFTLGVITNLHVDAQTLILRRLEPGQERIIDTPFPYQWPAGVISLSHVALPFAPDDPLYGGPRARPSPGLNLGNVSFHGERGILRIPASATTRLRYNPFYAYLEQRTLAFTALE